MTFPEITKGSFRANGIQDTAGSDCCSPTCFEHAVKTCKYFWGKIFLYEIVSKSHEQQSEVIPLSSHSEQLEQFLREKAPDVKSNLVEITLMQMGNENCLVEAALDDCLCAEAIMKDYSAKFTTFKP